jgi:hypothetical protein
MNLFFNAQSHILIPQINFQLMKIQTHACFILFYLDVQHLNG